MYVLVSAYLCLGVSMCTPESYNYMALGDLIKSIKYVTLLLTNFDHSLLLSHFVTHLGTTKNSNDCPASIYPELCKQLSIKLQLYWEFKL